MESTRHNLTADAGEVSAVSSVIGSETGYRLRMPRNEVEVEDDRDSYDYYDGDDDDEDDDIDPTEATSLLGAGARRQGGGGSLREEEDGPLTPEPIWAGYAEFEHLPRWRRPSIYWLLGPYLLFTLAFGGSIVPKLNLIVDLICKHHFADRNSPIDGLPPPPAVIPGGDNKQCQIPEVQRRVATFTMVLNLIVGALSAVTVPRIGSLSDRHGRKRLLVVASAGGVLGEIIIILATKYPDSVHYAWLIAGSFFDGLAGSFTAGSIVAHSYTSDCTPPSKRGVAIGFLHSCLFMGLAFGPMLAAYLVELTGGELVSVFYVTLGCHIFFILFISTVLPESLSERRQLVAREKHAQEKAERLAEREARRRAVATAPLLRGGDADDDNDNASIATTVTRRRSAAVIARGRKLFSSSATAMGESNPFAPLRILWPSGLKNAAVRRNLVVLAAIDTVLLGSQMSMGQVAILYSELMFGWGNLETSMFVSVVSLMRVFILLGVLPALNYVFRVLPARAAAKEAAAAAAAEAAEEEAASDADPDDAEAQAQRRPQRTTTTTTTVAEKNAGADELDVWMLRTALVSDVVGVLGYVLVRTPKMFVVSALIGAMGGLGSPTIQTALTKHVPPERVGQLLGAIGLLHALSRVVAPLVVNGLYAVTVSSYPPAVFVLMLVMFVLILGLAFFFRPYVYLKDDSDESPTLPPTRLGWETEEVLSDEEILPVP